MRINLDCPYSEKDDAKRLGAKWDPSRKVWYVVDPDDLQPFARWIKGMGRPTEHQAKKAARMGAKKRGGCVTIGRHFKDIPHPAGLLPWEEEDPPELVRLVRDIGLSHSSTR